MKQAIIVFVRHPEFGKVKTRLAATIGPDAALKVYIFLLRHTKGIIKNVHRNTFVFYAGDMPDDDMWSSEGFYRSIQTGESLGERMFNAFTAVFTAGFDQALIIGSDCYDLSSDLILLALRKLEEKDIVIGPAADGGYYLLGMHAPTKNLFEHIQWSTNCVFTDTLKIIERNQYTYYLLPVLRDVDTAEDIDFDYQ